MRRRPLTIRGSPEGSPLDARVINLEATVGGNKPEAIRDLHILENYSERFLGSRISLGGG